MLAVVTLLGLGSGALESANKPTETPLHFSQSADPSHSQQSKPGPRTEEQLASLDTSKL